jgi:hypothetical protein
MVQASKSPSFYFLALSPTSLNILSDVADIATKKLADENKI